MLQNKLLITFFLSVVATACVKSPSLSQTTAFESNCFADSSKLTEQPLPSNKQQRQKILASMRAPLVLMYHDIRIIKQTSEKPELCGPFDATLASDDALTAAEFDSFDLSCAGIKKQLQFLKDQNYKTLSLEEFFKIKSTNAVVPEKTVLLTFDDGYAGIFKYAVPELRKHNFKAAFFVHTNFIDIQPGDSKRKTSRHHMTTEQLKTLDDDPLFEVQSHTLNHLDSTVISEKDLGKELNDSRFAIENKLGGSRPFFAYPFGKHNKNVVACAQKFYSFAFIINNLETIWNPMMQVPRFEIHKETADIKQFDCRIRNYRLGLSEEELVKACS